MQQHSQLSNVIGKKTKKRKRLLRTKGVEVERSGRHVQRTVSKECNLL